MLLLNTSIVNILFGQSQLRILQYCHHSFVAIQSLSRVRLFATPWTAAYQVSLSFSLSQSLFKFMCTELVMLYYHLILCCPLSPFAFNLPQYQGIFQRVSSFPSGGQSIGLSASILPMNIQDWFPLRSTGWISLLSKGLSRVFSSTISKALILWCSTFFKVQLSHPHVTTAKTIGLNVQIFVGKVRSLLFIMLFRFVTAFFPRSKHLLISQLQSPWFRSPRK